MIRSILTLASLAAFAGMALGGEKRETPPPTDDHIFEMRTYYALPGKGPALNARFRDHTCALFKKHGMGIVGFWMPIDEKDGKETKLVYILSYPSKEAATASWKAFQADPEWKKARDASEVDGKLIDHIESVYLNPTDYSPIK